MVTEEEKKEEKPKAGKVEVHVRERTANGLWRCVGKKKLAKEEAEAGIESGKYLPVKEA